MTADAIYIPTDFVTWSATATATLAGQPSIGELADVAAQAAEYRERALNAIRTILETTHEDQDR